MNEFVVEVGFNTSWYLDGEWKDLDTVNCTLRFDSAEDMYKFVKYIEDVRSDLPDSHYVPLLEPSHSQSELLDIINNG